jgi:hypothetical protein
VFFKLIAFGLIGFGLFLTVFGIIFIRDGFAVNGWDKVSGEVVDVRIKIDSSLQNQAIGRAKSRRYFPAIKYRWTVEDKEYESSRYRLGASFQKFKTREAAKEAAKPFAQGSPVDVYVDPKDPSSAVLDRRANATFIPLVIGLLFTVTGGLLYHFKDQIAAQANQG